MFLSKFTKTILAFGLVMATSAIAAPSSAAAAVQASSLQSYRYIPRVKIYPDGRNAITPDGEILVCPITKSVDGSKCLDNTRGSVSAWARLEDDAPPGFVVASYEFRFAGSSGGYRSLIVYYERGRPL